jgi:hypothetical protein
LAAKIVALGLLIATFARAADDVTTSTVPGQRVFAAGHGLPNFMPPILGEPVASAS